MVTESISYPPTPENVDEQVLAPSSTFKREVLKALGAILFFILVYVALMAGGLGLAVLCALGGIGLVVLKPMGVTIMLGIGLAGLGAMVLFFLIKFLFKSHKVDRSGLTEIKESDQPKLFAFIRRLANETRTPFPKKIYLSQDVNASVFYDSGFWSMFLPVRKNLMIGLGLVNSVTSSEFKAIVAHEFGHFSQRSMKLGSYVYNLNQVIFNLLFDNEGYDSAIERWANASGYFALFAAMTIRIVKGIQWILQQVYTIVNRQYLSLSRQMEFHADAVSASVSGGNHLIASLRRLEVAEMTYNSVLGFYSENIKNGFKPDNLYQQHRAAMAQFCKLNGLPIENGLPQINADSFARFNKSRLTIKDQWASHPSTDDRENHLRSLNINTPSQDHSAWQIFDSPNSLQEEFTQKIFHEVKYDTSVQLLTEATFIEQYNESNRRYELPSIYKGFFDSRNLTSIDLRNLETRIAIDGLSLENILSDELLALPYRQRGIASDLQTLEAINSGNLTVKNFEFEGQKYSAKEAPALIIKLKNELNEVDRSLADGDQKIISWFLQSAGENKEKLREKYSDLFMLEEATNNDMKIYESMNERLMPLYQTMKFAQIEEAVSELKKEEVEFKKRLELIINNPENTEFISQDQREQVKEYLSRDWKYFLDQMYLQDNLNRLNVCLYTYYAVTNEKLFHRKASLLKLQLEFVGLSVEQFS